MFLENSLSNYYRISLQHSCSFFCLIISLHSSYDPQTVLAASFCLKAQVLLLHVVNHCLAWSNKCTARPRMWAHGDRLTAGHFFLHLQLYLLTWLFKQVEFMPFFPFSQKVKLPTSFPCTGFKSAQHSKAHTFLSRRNLKHKRHFPVSQLLLLLLSYALGFFDDSESWNY